MWSYKKNNVEVFNDYQQLFNTNKFWLLFSNKTFKHKKTEFTEFTLTFCLITSIASLFFVFLFFQIKAFWKTNFVFYCSCFQSFLKTYYSIFNLKIFLKLSTHLKAELLTQLKKIDCSIIYPTISDTYLRLKKID